MEYMEVASEQVQEGLQVVLEEGRHSLDLFDVWAAEALASYGVEQAPVRPRVALIAFTLASVLFLYSLFMVLLGVFLARVFGKSGDAQIMQMIHQIERTHDDVVRTQEHLEAHKRKRGWWKSTLLMLAVPLEVAIAGVLYVYEGDALLGRVPNTDYAQIALEASPLVAVPLLMFVLYKVLAYWHSSRIQRNVIKLKDLQKHHEELVKRYEEKIDAEQHKRVMSVIRDTRALFGTPSRPQLQQQQQRPSTGVGTQVPVAGGPAPRPRPSPTTRPQQQQQQQRMAYPSSMQQPIRQSAPGVRASRSGVGATQEPSDEEAPAGKLISSAMGLLSGGAGAVELVCKVCGHHCGSQPKEELLQFDCSRCGAFNDGTAAKKTEASEEGKKESSDEEEKEKVGDEK